MGAVHTAVSVVESLLGWLARPLRLGLGYVWSAGLLLFGLWLWDQQTEVLWPLLGWAGAGPGEVVGSIRGDVPGYVSGVVRVWDQLTRGLAIFAISGAQFVFMFLVADDLCPNTPLMLSEFLEFFSGALALGSLVWAMWVLCLGVIQ